MLPAKRKTFQLTKEKAQDNRMWHVVDVSNLPLGRAATQIAHLLRGKHKPSFTQNVDSGDFVVVVNANQLMLTGRKMEGKLYYKHTLFPGGLRKTPAKEMIQEKSDRMIRQAVWGMLPKGPLGRVIIKKLKIYAGAQHPHDAQQPKKQKLLSMRKGI